MLSGVVLQLCCFTALFRKILALRKLVGLGRMQVFGRERWRLSFLIT